MHVTCAGRGSVWGHTFATWLFVALAALPLATRAGSDAPAPLPLLEAQLLDGGRFVLADKHGVVPIVVFWSPDSLASRKSLGELQRFAARNTTDDVQVIAVSTLDDVSKIRHFAYERKLDIPLATLAQSNLGPFPNSCLPYIMVFNRQGKLHAVHRGLFRLQTLEGLLAPLK